jgi:hypothetical protein
LLRAGATGEELTSRVGQRSRAEAKLVGLLKWARDASDEEEVLWQYQLHLEGLAEAKRREAPDGEPTS